jgi:hypothetical protein
MMKKNPLDDIEHVQAAVVKQRAPEIAEMIKTLIGRKAPFILMMISPTEEIGPNTGVLSVITEMDTIRTISMLSEVLNTKSKELLHKVAEVEKDVAAAMDILDPPKL